LGNKKRGIGRVERGNNLRGLRGEEGMEKTGKRRGKENSMTSELQENALKTP